MILEHVPGTRLPPRKAGWLVVILFLSILPGLNADSRSSETWLLYERGNTALSEGEFGTALSFYKDAIQRAVIFPEAEMAVGDVYAEEGEADLALLQYEKAYNQRKSFTIPDMQYEVLYRSARLCQVLERYRQMEDKLNLILRDDTHFAETTSMQLRSQIEKNFHEKGLDRVLVLYRFDQSFSAAAHTTLGWFYYRTGRYEQAVSHLLYAVIYRISQVNRYLHDRDVDYQFTTMEALASVIRANQDLSAFAVESDLYKVLYYLGGAAYATERRDAARAMWTILAASPQAVDYQELSRRQLRSPFLEPLLTLNSGSSR